MNRYNLMKIYIKTSVDLNIDSIEKYNFQTKRKRMANILKLKYLISNE